MLTNIDQGGQRRCGRQTDFPREATRGFFQNLSRGSKSSKICFFPLETKKTTFFAKMFKIQGGAWPPLSPFRTPMYVDATWLTFIIH